MAIPFREASLRYALENSFKTKNYCLLSIFYFLSFVT